MMKISMVSMGLVKVIRVVFISGINTFIFKGMGITKLVKLDLNLLHSLERC